MNLLVWSRDYIIKIAFLLLMAHLFLFGILHVIVVYTCIVLEKLIHGEKIHSQLK